MPCDPDALRALRTPTPQHPWRVLVVEDDNCTSTHAELQAFLAHPAVTRVPLDAQAQALIALGETCDLALLLDTSTRVADLLWERWIPFASQHDVLTLAALCAWAEGREAGLEHLDAPWSLQESPLSPRGERSKRRSVFKILDAAAWDTRDDQLPWAPIDVRDGFVHLSTGDQLDETLALHFAGRTQLVVVELDPAQIPALVWEPSRGGQLFPHAYGRTPLTAVLGTTVR